MKRFFYSIHILITFSLSILKADIDEVEPFSEFKKDKIYSPLKMEDVIIVDGVLDEQSWQESNYINDFIQVFPDYFSKCLDSTIVKILYDDKNLYIGVVLSQNIENLTQKVGEYDDFSETFDMLSDYFIVEIDSRHNHNTSYGFAVNSSGVLSDYMIYEDGLEDVDDYWNANWEAEVTIDQNKWFIEYKIPFIELRYIKKKSNTWGVNFIRYTKYNNATHVWSVLPMKTDRVVSEYGHLINLNLKNQVSIKFKPYFWVGEIDYDDYFHEIINISTNPELGSLTKYSKDIKKDKYGFDVKYNFKSQHIIDLTYNPDFGQIDQDPSVINNTAYEIRFDEKRPFFLENFTFYDTPINVFYSRRIGGEISYAHSISDLILGSEVSSTRYMKTNFNKAVNYISNNNQVQFGFLYASSNVMKYSTDIYDIDDREVNYKLSRIKYFLPRSNSYIGFLNTHYDYYKDTSKTNSLDFLLTFLDDQSIYFDGQLAQTNLNGAYGLGLNFELGYSSPLYTDSKYDFWLKYENYDKKFDISKMGYLVRNDLQEINFGGSLITFDLLNFKQRKITTQYFLAKNYSNQKIRNNINIQYEIILNNYNVINIELSKDFKYYIDRFYDFYFDGQSDNVVRGTEYERMLLNYKNDLRSSMHYSIGLEYFKDNFNNNGKRYLLFNKFNINKKNELEFSFEENIQYSKFHFLKIDKKAVHGGISSNHNELNYLFVNSNNNEKYLSFKLSSYLKNNLSLSLYYEFYRYLSNWDNSDIYVIDEQESWPTQTNEFQIDSDDYIIYYGKYTKGLMNFVVKSKALNNSDIYFVYSISKAVNGKIFNSVFNLLDYKHKDGIEQEADIFYDESFFIKYDYWFEI